MSAVRQHIRLLAIVGLVGAAGQAAAQDIDGALERLRTLVSEQGAAIDWESADISGSDVTLVGVSVGAQDEMVPIGNIDLTGVSETDESYRIERIELPHYTIGDDEGTVAIDGVSLTGVLVPKEGQQGPYGSQIFYETADLQRATVIVGDAEVATLSDLHFEITLPENGEPMAFTGAAENFTVDLSSLDDSEQKAVMEALGYTQLSGYFEMAGSWEPEAGHLDLSQYDFTVVDAGTLSFTFGFGGYTMEFQESLQQVQRQMAANPDADQSAQGLAMLGLMQQLTLRGAEIAFVDDGLTNKVLDFIAAQQGMNRGAIVNQAKALLPFALMQLNNQQLTQMVTTAVSSFLDDPQSLRIRLAPENEVPFAMVVAGAMTSPEQLPNTLGVVVTAND